jgi:3-phenylpropionate/trans-cinnamate dioxygenase ferredoxin subunit
MPGEITWHLACRAEELQVEDVTAVTINGKVYAIYRLAGGCYATDGLCTHEQSPLANGFVSGEIVECAKHNARFHIPTGKALRRPALKDLACYPVREDGGGLYIGITGDAQMPRSTVAAAAP